MEEILICENCKQPFDTGIRTPKIFNKCGHTICLDCARSVDQKCPICQTPHAYESPEQLPDNN